MALMNTRERFLAVMAFETGVRPPKWEMGYWVGTVRRWYAEGLPERRGLSAAFFDGEGVTGGAEPWTWERPRGDDVRDSCDLDEGLERVPVDAIFSPRFNDEILEDHGDRILHRDKYGVVRREPKDRSSLPRFVGWPVKTRDDWERLKAERLRPSLAGRVPADWTAIKERFRRRTFPLAIGGVPGGFFGTPRLLLGEEDVLLSFYDTPQLIRDIINDLCDFWIALFDNVLSEVRVDLALHWEDMCYKTGPLISPALVREFMLPAYKKLTAFYRDRGIPIILLDTDGDCRSLISLFVEGGITGLYPFEVNANMDVLAVREQFPRLQILGGLNKLALLEGRAATDQELETKVPAMLRLGGYVPFIDHLVPPDVSLASFLYYRRRLNSTIDSVS